MASFGSNFLAKMLVLLSLMVMLQMLFVAPFSAAVIAGKLTINIIINSIERSIFIKIFNFTCFTLNQIMSYLKNSDFSLSRENFVSSFLLNT